VTCYYVFYLIIKDHNVQGQKMATMQVTTQEKTIGAMLLGMPSMTETSVTHEVAKFKDVGKENLETLRHALCMINFMVFI
jgi:hypothetical protein